MKDLYKLSQKEGLAYLNKVGFGCLAYKDGFGKIACGIINTSKPSVISDNKQTSSDKQTCNMDHRYLDELICVKSKT